MLAIEAIQNSIQGSQFICDLYLKDLTDDELFARPLPEMNHINWQIGHLTLSEHRMIEAIRPGSMTPLPAGFSEKYAKATVSNDDPTQFLTKAELLAVAAEQRKGTLAALAKEVPETLDAASGLSYAPTVAAVYGMQAAHWLLHSGQWAVVRRKLGRSIVM